MSQKDGARKGGSCMHSNCLLSVSFPSTGHKVHLEEKTISRDIQANKDWWDESWDNEIVEVSPTADLQIEQPRKMICRRKSLFVYLPHFGTF